MNKIFRTYNFVKKLPITVQEFRVSLSQIQKDLSSYKVAQDSLKEQVDESLESLTHELGSLKQKQSDVLHQVNVAQLSVKSIAKPATINTSSDLQADDHRLDGYYRAFEDKFRGSEEVIRNRLSESYSTFLDSLPKDLKKFDVVDIGCGRGELLKIFDERGMKSLGIDLNESMVQRCTDLGLNAIQGDAIAYLKGLKSSSIAGVTGIHIVEHIPFEVLYDLLNECYRVIKPGGFVLFETPNAENLNVGALTFWYDSSHLKPVPPAVLKFATEYVGFNPVDILRFRPDFADEDLPKSANLARVYKQLYGPRDYAIIGRK